MRPSTIGNAGDPVRAEGLEPRVMLAAVNADAVSARLDGTTLYVTGTDAADNVELRRSGGRLRVYVAGKPYRTLDPSAVERVRASLGRGQDRLDLSRAYVRASRVEAGGNNDVIVGSSRSDSIRGGAGSDVLYGGEGDDTLRGEDGQDDVYGGPGDDHVDGGYDRDDLYGEEGDDFLDADDVQWEDDVDGGPGEDEAQADYRPSSADPFVPWDDPFAWSSSSSVIDDVDRVEDVDWKP